MHFRKCKIEDHSDTDDNQETSALIIYTDNGAEKFFEAKGNGPVDAVQKGLAKVTGQKLRVLDYSEHALNAGGNAQAAAYIHLMDEDTKKAIYGVGVSSNITRASIRAMFSALNRLNRPE